MYGFGSILAALLALQSTCAFAPRPVKVARTEAALYSTQRPAASSSPSSDAVEKLHQLFNTQITNELSASQLYLSASIWCEAREFVGMASFMRAESNEERGHALSLIDFANKRDIPVKLMEIPAPECCWDTLEDIWRDLLDSEKANTRALYELADSAQTCHDHAITTLLMPFHSEQVESEGQLKTILAKVHEEKLTPGLVYQLDTELGRAGM